MPWTSKLPIIACALIIFFCAYVAYDLNGDSFDFSGKEVVIVMTDSMDGDVHGFAVDSYPADTVLMYEHVPSHEVRLIRAGEVAVYHSGDRLITHRVVGVDTEGSCLIVKGDNSPLEERVAFDDVVGVVVGANQWLGAGISFIKANLIGILVLGTVIAAGSLTVHRYRIAPEDRRTKLRNGAAFGIAIAAVAAMALAGVGYAYTASTENTGNSVSSEYVVLAQSNYTFSAGASFTYYSITSGADTYYYLQDDSPTLKQILDTGSGYTNHNGKYYWGVRIGDPTTLSISAVNYELTDHMCIQVGMSTVDNERFTKFTTNDWQYFMKIYYVENERVYDIHWLWSKGNGWNIKVGGGTSDGKVAKITIDPTKDYIAELYLGAPGIIVSDMTVTTASSGAAKASAGCKTEPKGNTGLDPSGRMLIKDGWVSFAFDINDNLPVITFDKNGGSGTMSSQKAAYGTGTQLNTNTFTNSGTFAGWNTRADGTGTHYDDGGSIVVTQDITLYAQWN